MAVREWNEVQVECVKRDAGGRRGVSSERRRLTVTVKLLNTGRTSRDERAGWNLLLQRAVRT